MQYRTRNCTHHRVLRSISVAKSAPRCWLSNARGSGLQSRLFRAEIGWRRPRYCKWFPRRNGAYFAVFSRRARDVVQEHARSQTRATRKRRDEPMHRRGSHGGPSREEGAPGVLSIEIPIARTEAAPNQPRPDAAGQRLLQRQQSLDEARHIAHQPRMRVHLARPQARTGVSDQNQSSRLRDAINLPLHRLEIQVAAVRCILWFSAHGAVFGN